MTRLSKGESIPAHNKSEKLKRLLNLNV